MKKLYGILIVSLGLACCTGLVRAAESKKPGVAEVTVITSERLTFDYEEQYALFEENVVVEDPEMKLSADRMTVHFSADNDVKSIIARGNVSIDQDDRLATSERAVYDVESGKIQLDGNPRVRRGRDVLEGTTISFWRDQNKMVCEPQARLVIYPHRDKSSQPKKALGE